MTSRPRLRLGVLLATLVAGSISGGPAGAEDTPTIDLGTGAGSPGETLLVTGSAWQPGTIVVLEICGNEALDGAADCAAGSAANVGVQPDGTFSTLISVAEPPSPCPCLVQVTSTSEITELRLPFEVQGAPVAPPLARAVPPAIQRALAVRRAVLEGSGWRGWLGLGARRTLVLEVENVGDVNLRGVPLMVSAGRGDSPDGHVDAPDIGDLAPGQRRVLRVPIEFDALEFGALRVVGSIHGVGEPVRFATQTSNPPVLPLLLLALVIQWALLRVRNWLRRRIHHRDDGDEGEGPLPPEAEPGPAAGETVVIDLDAPPVPVAATGDQPEHTPVDVVPGQTVDVLDAREGLRAAVERSQALVAESTARSRELEADLEARLQAAAARQASSRERLDQAKERAEELLAAATEEASAMLREAEIERESARRAWAEAEGARVRSVDNAWTVLEAFIRQYGTDARPSPVETVKALHPPSVPQRFGSLDQSIARAVSRALAATMPDHTLVD